MKSIMRWLTRPPIDGPASTVLIRLMAGGVFFWEGILKFVYVNQGVGRFTKLGMPFPVFTADFVGGLEIVGGRLLMAGFLTRMIAIPFVVEMIVAMLSTKISLYLGTSPLPLPPAPPKNRRVGGLSRDSLGVCANYGRALPAYQWARKMVARRVSGEGARTASA
jgi:hypothetical protein